MKTKEKVKKPIFKRWWFWVIVVFIAIGIFAPSTEDPGVDTNQPPSSIDANDPAPNEGEDNPPANDDANDLPPDNDATDPPVKNDTNDTDDDPPAPDPSEAQKEAAKAIDAKISAICVKAESEYQEFLNSISSGNITDLTAYNAAKTLKANLQHYNYQELSDLEGEGIDEYKQSASLYIFSMSEVADKAMKYIDDPITSKLSAYQDSMEHASSYTYDVVLKRLAFLADAGFTTEEITAITDTGE